MMEPLPYILKLGDPTLYPHDFYLNQVFYLIPNERIIFSYILLFFIPILNWVCLISHGICGVLLFLGWYKISNYFIQNRLFSWLAILLAFSILYGVNLGGNELYYNMLVPSLLAKCLGTWALYFILRARRNLGFSLLIPAVFIQPVAGAQLFLIIAGAIAIMAGIDWKKWVKLLIQVLPFVVIAGTWLVLLKSNYSGGNHGEEIMNIFEFRLAHHYFPASFGLKKYVIFGVLYFAALFFFRQHKMILWICILTLAGCMIYSAGLYGFSSHTILMTQWFKSTIWLKPLACIAAIALLLERLPALKTITYPNRIPVLNVMILMFAVVLFFIKPTNQDWPWKHEPNAESSIGRLAKNNSPQNALFAVPMEATYFKYFSQRSSFVDFKSIAHHPDGMKTWSERVELLYGIGPGDGGNKREKGKRFWLSHGEAFFRQLKEDTGVGYILTYSQHELNFPPIAADAYFTAYRIE